MEIFIDDKYLKMCRKQQIKKRLDELSQDFIQAQLGAEIEDIQVRKLEFKALHNELRFILGKPIREYKNVEVPNNETKDN